MATPRSPGELTVGIVALPETSGAVLYGIREVLSCVGVTWEEMMGGSAPGNRFRTRVAAVAPEPFSCALNVPVVPDMCFEPFTRCDIVIVPDLALPSGFDPRGSWPQASAWLRRQHAEGSLICSVCTGSVLLAESGLLNGLDATTHWAISGAFGGWYPAVNIQPERVLVPAGSEHRLVTSGGSASWTDLVLYLIARFCGRQEAIRTAKLFLLGDRSDGQLPFAAMMQPRRHSDAVIDECQTWLADNYAAANPVASMTARSRLAPRTFKRRFRKATGYTPIEYVQTLRIEEAKHLLETTSMQTDEIALAVGYQDPASFRRLFKRHSGVTPARYRQHFKTIFRSACLTRERDPAVYPGDASARASR